MQSAEEGNHRLEAEDDDAAYYHPMSSFCLESGRDEAVEKEGREESSSQQDNSALHYILFISVFAILGSCLRVYMARFFGEDCETDKDLDDFLMPLSSKICVTASGRTEQTGGALFIDLPANLLGSFIMGFITPNTPTVDRLPFLGTNHPLQKDAIYHTGLGVGLCGSLTTFASWNTQMIVMLDGSYTELGSQIAPVLFGYILGLMGAIACFSFGRTVSQWVCDAKNKHNTISTPPPIDEEEPPMQPIDDATNNIPYTPPVPTPQPSSFTCAPSFVRAVPFVLASTVIFLFVLGYVLEGVHFYRTMIAKSMTAPIGALLRWKLSGYNTRPEGAKYSWVPVGTLSANLLAAVVSIVCIVFQDRFHDEEDLWVDAILFSMRVGFAGCLSTVSSMVKEVVNLSEKYPGHAKPYIYGFGTIFAAICTCLPLYSIIGRVGL